MRRDELAAVMQTASEQPPTSRPMDQVGNPVPYRAGNEQSCQRLLRCISADRCPGMSALLINCDSRLTGMVCDVASHTLDRIYRLGSGDRRF